MHQSLDLGGINKESFLVSWPIKSKSKRLSCLLFAVALNLQHKRKESKTSSNDRNTDEERHL